MELNIGPDGDLDWPPEILASFDLCLACVHSAFTQQPEQMTRRLIRAVENPFVSILGHPSGRLIGRREPVEVDAFPDRLDARDEHVRMALREAGRRQRRPQHLAAAAPASVPAARPGMNG